MPNLFIRLLSPAVATEEGFRVDSAWMIQEDDGRIRAQGETDFRGLSELIDPATDWIKVPHNIVVTVPSEYVLSLTCDVPGRSVGQMRRALPFVVEEFVTTDIESMHLASGELRRGAPARVNLIERALLQDWLACLEALQIRPGYLFSEAELLPVAEGQASLLIDGDRVLIRTQDQAAALDRSNLVLAVGALNVDQLVVVHGALNPLEQEQLAAEVEIRADESQAQTTLDYMAAHWHDADLINLLQGGFQVSQPVSPEWARWRAVAALAALWVAVALVTTTSQGLYASYRADALEAESERLYREIFPQERRVTNVRRQLQAKLGERTGEGGTDFMDFLAALASIMSPTVRIQSLSYSDERKELAVDIVTAGFDELDQLKQRLSTQGVRVDITSAEQQDQGVRARIRLRGAGADA